MADPIVRYTGVYNADGGLVGEARYVFSKIVGSSSCALCDITHGNTIRGKSDWRECKSSFPVPIDVSHRNEQTSPMNELTRGQLPCVVAHHDSGSLSIAVRAAQLEACNDDVAALRDLLLQLLITTRA
jgi:hypothetical protein